MKRWAICLSVFLIFSWFVASAQAVSFVETASDISDQIEAAANQTGDDVIVFTDHGQPILPDLEKRKIFGKGQSVNEINFTFESPYYPWTDSEITTLNQWVQMFYPVMRAVYGEPAFAITINIEKDPTISADGYYFPSSNEMIMRNLSVDVFCHETIHAFHDDIIMAFNSYEEGMTRAAEVAVFKFFPQEQFWYWDYAHSYMIDQYYELSNQPGIGAAYGNFWMGFPGVLSRYQQAGYAWGKCYLEDRNFFKRFNNAYYQAAEIDDTVPADEQELKALAGRVKSKVENIPFDVWYDQQEILNLSPATGYQTFFKADNNILFVYYRNESGGEISIAGVNVTWDLNDCEGSLLASGSAITVANGWVQIPVWEVQKLNYQGKVIISLSVTLSEGTVLNQEIQTFWGIPDGIFGITGSCDGTVTVRSKGGIRATTEVINGAFSFPELRNVAGTFTLTNSGTKTVTKDASAYFVAVP